uniref:Protein kinase domain-containing protein n=1 Tax=Panagrellus redivivus TaxID=6233 RepID=A0A7E4VNZ4_PANRE
MINNHNARRRDPERLDRLRPVELREYLILGFTEAAGFLPERPPRFTDSDPVLYPLSYTASEKKTRKRYDRPISRGPMNWRLGWFGNVETRHRATARLVDIDEAMRDDDYISMRRYLTSLAIDLYIAHFFNSKHFLKAYTTFVVREGFYCTLFPRHGSLETFIDVMKKNQREFKTDIVYYVTSSVLDALSFLHCAALVHNDLTPGAVFFDENGNIKLGDFIYADYVSEEQENDQYSAVGVTGFRLDVIAAGNIMAEMVLGADFDKIESDHVPVFNFNNDALAALQFGRITRNILVKTTGENSLYGRAIAAIHESTYRDASLANNMYINLFGDEQMIKAGQKRFVKYLEEFKLRPKPFTRENTLLNRLKPQTSQPSLVLANAQRPETSSILNDGRSDFLRQANDSVIDLDIFMPHHENAVNPDYQFRVNFQKEPRILMNLLRFVETEDLDAKNIKNRHVFFPWEILTFRRALYDYVKKRIILNVASTRYFRYVELSPVHGNGIYVKFKEVKRMGDRVTKLDETEYDLD